MHHLDLRDFADHSQKIPSTLLNRAHKKKVGTIHILGAHLVDFFAVFYGSLIISVLLQTSTSSFLASARLMKMAHSGNPMTVLFPVMLFGYFFFCNFFNHGQSYGMYKFKIRQCMQENSYTNSFTGAVWSFLLSLSFGALISKYKENVQMEKHDWVYQELMRVKDVKSIDLLSCVEAYSAPAQEEKEEFNIAA